MSRRRDRQNAVLESGRRSGPSDQPISSARSDEQSPQGLLSRAGRSADNRRLNGRRAAQRRTTDSPTPARPAAARESRRGGQEPSSAQQCLARRARAAVSHACRATAASQACSSRLVTERETERERRNGRGVHSRWLRRLSRARDAAAHRQQRPTAVEAFPQTSHAGGDRGRDDGPRPSSHSFWGPGPGPGSTDAHACSGPQTGSPCADRAGGRGPGPPLLFLAVPGGGRVRLALTIRCRVLLPRGPGLVLCDGRAFSETTRLISTV
ncbi:hypothetical protein CDD83_2180 [Cordyceps sp. RAO-2017]|nr:hypothetical protein CDD83_2180 [Cordyceps sp. RAO-2017]